MRISTTLNTLNPVESKGGYPPKKIMRMLAEAGFKCVDLCAFKYIGEGSDKNSHPLCGDGWRNWVGEIGEYAAANGIVFNQSHNLTFNFFRGDEETAFLDKMLDRVIEASAMLSIPVTVLHPIEPPGASGDVDICLKKNREYFLRKADVAGRFGMKLAIENMLSSFHLDGSVYWRYCSAPEQLLELVERIDRENVGICFDIGHAHYMHGESAKELRMMQKQLLALHIHDNDRFSDQHLLPYQGTIDWESVCRALAEIHYSGDFTLEIANAVSRMPETLQPAALKNAYEMAAYLVSRTEYYSEKSG